ncbi:MAG: hypothetical protein ACM3H8_07525 [Sphingobacteriales bacterium]
MIKIFTIERQAFSYPVAWLGPEYLLYEVDDEMLQLKVNFHYPIFAPANGH